MGSRTSGSVFRRALATLVWPLRSRPRPHEPAPSLLSEAERLHFSREGYLVIESGIADGLLDEAKEQLRDRYPRVDGSCFPLSGRIQDAWKFCPAVKATALAPRVLRAIGELHNQVPLPFQTLNFPVGTEQAVHSDTIHFNSMPSGGMCGVWVALEDIDMDNGPLVYYPGSHRLPEITLEDIGIPVLVNNHENYAYYERYIARLVDLERWEPNYATVPKGSAFIWASNLLHGGSPRRDRSRSRFSQVTHYFFRGHRYYTPLFSTCDRPHWRDPEEIS